MFQSLDPRRLAGAAGIAGGLGWAVRPVLTFVADGGTAPLGYGALDAFTPLALALALVGVVGHRARTHASWGRLAKVGFGVFVAGLVGALAGTVAYLVWGLLVAWTLSVWSYFLALIGSTVFGIGLLWAGIPPRSGAALLAGVLPLGLAVSLALAVGGVVPHEAVVPVGPGVFLGTGVAVLGWWVATRSCTASERT